MRSALNNILSKILLFNTLLPPSFPPISPNNSVNEHYSKKLFNSPDESKTTESHKVHSNVV